jgi:hypothetical protein
MRRNGVKLGDWLAKCDRCADVLYASQLRKEWTGWMVCEQCWEPRHPQEFLKGRKEDENVPWTRPDSDFDDTDYNGDVGKTIRKGTDADIQNWNTELTNNRVVILDVDAPQKGDRLIIYKTVDDDNKLILTSKTLDSGTTV